MTRWTKRAPLPTACAILLAAFLAACAGVTPAGGGGANPAGSWGWETRGPPGFIESRFGGRDMN